MPPVAAEWARALPGWIEVWDVPIIFRCCHRCAGARREGSDAGRSKRVGSFCALLGTCPRTNDSRSAEPPRSGPQELDEDVDALRQSRLPEAALTNST